MENGAKSPGVYAISRMWEGELLGNQAPVISNIAFSQLPEIISVNDTLNIFTRASDPEDDSLTYHWEVTKDHKKFNYVPHQVELRPQAIPGLFSSSAKNELVFKAPAESGTYRIYVTVYDSSGKGTTANLPFLV